ncbi:hypothetical protein ACFOOM_26400 [Streptomyces echinoruber]|uniref:Uncharacterized protein n=1 Tax=Streptomyces echinoruber TaxID=68898 RepID=A0A918VP49_9ACTN|nr:hypothetical protein [Streptomyces echinoruber]GHA11382.1 hypothetical protein GCM10010389_58100 [Streptomyces echinoruber]
MSDAMPEAETPDGTPAEAPAETSDETPAEPEHDPSAPAPLDVPRTPTGHAEVDAALERLADADHLATDGHVAVYEDVHRGLRDALTALDTRPGPPVPAPPPGTPAPTAPPGPRTPAPPYDRRS